MKTVSLTNTTNRMAVFLLTHEQYCKALGRCVCRPVPGRSTKKAPSSLTIPAQTKVDALPEAVLQVSAVQEALKTGRLRHTVERSRRKREVVATKPERKKQKAGEK